MGQQAFLEFISLRLPSVLEIKRTTCVEYGRIRARLFKNFAPKEWRQRGIRPEQLVDPVTALELRIQENDIWLAAQALEYNLVFATSDRQIQRIQDICTEFQVEDWAI
jgi:tRNA(fMet)-specific endonuclease VapC